VARPATGSIRSRVRNGRHELTLRFSAYGQRYELPAGTDDETRARARLDEILDQVKRSSWQPPRPIKPAPPRAAEPTFGEFAEQWFRGKAPELTERGREDYLWALNTHLLPYFTERLLSEITVQTVDEYREAKVREAKLGPTSINKTIARLAQILDLAVEYGLIPANPARGRRRRMKAAAPRRTYLEAEQVMAVLDAAGELDRESTHYGRIGRRAIMATLMLAGLRVGELAELRWEAVDLTNRRLHVRDAKTQAGVRVIPISSFLHDELVAYRAQAVESELVFPTGTGQQRDRNNIRNRIHNPVIARANANLATQDRPLIQPGLTPHALRRTYISLLLEAGENVRSVMAWSGHASPNITLSIYAQVLSSPGSRELAQHLLWEPGAVNGAAPNHPQ
jgi:integrase